MFKYTPVILFLFILFSCKTTTAPIVYDKSTSYLDKEAELIQLLIRNENYIDAEKKISNDLASYPDNTEITLLKGWLLLQEDKLNESEQIFLQLLEKNKKNPLALTGLARINRRNGSTEKAKQYLDDGLFFMPGNSYLWLEKGIMEYDAKDYKKALVDFSKAYALDTNNYDSYFFKYITMLQMNKEFEDIKQYWDFLLKKKNLQSWYFQYHADILYNLNFKDYAKIVVKTGLETFPNDPYLLNLSAYYSYNDYLANNDQETLSNAKTNILKCIDISKEIKPEFIDTYFLILEKNNEIDLLKKEFNRYILLFPDSTLISGWGKKLLNK